MLCLLKVIVFELRFKRIITEIQKRILINSMKRSSKVLLLPTKWKWMRLFFVSLFSYNLN